MILSPYNFEPALTEAEYAKLGILALRWSHIEHILGNCLKVILRLTDDEAVIVVFSLSADQRAEKIHQLSKLSELPAPAMMRRARFSEVVTWKRLSAYRG